MHIPESALHKAAYALFLRERAFHTPTDECPEPPEWEELRSLSHNYYRAIGKAVLTAAGPDLIEANKENE